MKAKRFRSISCSWLMIAVVCLLLLAPMTSMASIAAVSAPEEARWAGTTADTADAGEASSSGRSASLPVGLRKRLAAQFSDFHHFLSIRTERTDTKERTRSPLEQLLCSGLLYAVIVSAVLLPEPTRLLCGAASSPLRFLRSIRLRN